MIFRKKELFLMIVVALGGCNDNQKILQVTRIKVDSLSQIHLIKDSLVKPIVYTHIKDLKKLPVPKAKALFISAVLPSILITKHNLETERQKVHELSEKKKWIKEDSTYYLDLKRKYKAADIENLLKRMSTVPNSIVLAQAAVESGWGQSRFFREGNNIFGMWSYNRNEPRIRAGINRETGPIHVRAYDDISQSIEDYFKTLGSAHAYRELRTALQESNDPFKLLPHLKYYSEKRNAYTDQLRKLIKYNNLTQYDSYVIDPQYFVAP
ncbi:MAG: glucosaminidase domain-containing protein [Cyclobacteriaceae bacterium]